MLKPLISSSFLKPALAATAVLVLAGSSFVYAQQGFGGRGGFGAGAGMQQYHHRQFSVADVNAFADARIAGLKAGLELTPDQAKNWPPFEQALRDMVQLRVQRIQARQAAAAAQQQQVPASPFDRMARRADMMSKRGAALKKIADAGMPLYQSLNDEQKSRFKRLARILRPHPHMHAFLQHWRQGERFGEGNDRDGQPGGQPGGQDWHHHLGPRFGQETDQGAGGDSRL